MITVVFSILKPSACAECGAELLKGSLLRMENRSRLPRMRRSRPSGVSSTRRRCADTPQPEIFNLVGRNNEIQPFSQKLERRGLLVDPVLLNVRRRNVSATKEGAKSRARRLRSPESELTTSTSRNSWIAFVCDTQIALLGEAEAIAKTRVRSTAGELAVQPRQSHLMQWPLILRSRLTFVIRTPSTIGCCHRGGNKQRRGMLCGAK